ncbi:MAG TPA: extracellular solute-binding protein, partial [Anaerolineae bacterium]|nr:extracellular solute-binding protein [Anaerolineae bacterium]
MKKIINLISIISLLALLVTLAPAPALAQEEVVCESDVVVQADDWLSKLADKFYGDPLAFPAIADATNAKAATDDSYATIANVDVIEVGWKLCIPSAGEAQAALGEDRPVLVSILNQEMTKAEIAEAIRSEGNVVVGNWTYTANDALVQQFQQYVLDTYGVEVTLDYQATQQPNTYLTALYAAQQAGNPSPYDVLAIEENYWADALKQGAVADFLPSGLVPNQALVSQKFQRVPTAIAFQATAFPAIVYSKSRAGEVTKIADLADPRFKGRVTLPLPGDITAGGFLVTVATEMGKDYKDPQQMVEVVDWVVDNIGPNVLKYTTDSSEMQQLLRSGAVDAVGFWNSLARLEYLNGNDDAALLIPPTGVYPANGYLWIPKGAPHPVLAQIFINWRLNPEVQFPNDWGIEPGPWAELQEGFLGPSYSEELIPDWIKDNYFEFYPTSQQIDELFLPLDWEAYNAGFDT